MEPLHDVERGRAVGPTPRRRAAEAGRQASARTLAHAIALIVEGLPAVNGRPQPRADAVDLAAVEALPAVEVVQVDESAPPQAPRRAARASGRRTRPAEPAPAPPLVRVADVFKIYREGTTETVALRGASLELIRGEVTSLIGPSGSGKSTLVSVLAGLALPSAGRIMLGDKDITRLGEAERARLRARRIGVVRQSGNLIPFLSALENVELSITVAGGGNARRRARGLLEDLGLGGRVHHRPRQLSGGEAQRVAVAAALVNEPELLLADEVTGELDTETAAQVMEVILEASRQRGLTVLLVTHNRQLAATAQRRLQLVDGVVLAADAPVERRR